MQELEKPKHAKSKFTRIVVDKDREFKEKEVKEF
jgi:hypothetical protein